MMYNYPPLGSLNSWPAKQVIHLDKKKKRFTGSCQTALINGRFLSFTAYHLLPVNPHLPPWEHRASTKDLQFSLFWAMDFTSCQEVPVLVSQASWTFSSYFLVSLASSCLAGYSPGHSLPMYCQSIPTFPTTILFGHQTLSMYLRQMLTIATNKPSTCHVPHPSTLTGSGP